MSSICVSARGHSCMPLQMHEKGQGAGAHGIHMQGITFDPAIKEHPKPIPPEQVVIRKGACHGGEEAAAGVQLCAGCARWGCSSNGRECGLARRPARGVSVWVRMHTATSTWRERVGAHAHGDQHVA